MQVIIKLIRRFWKFLLKLIKRKELITLLFNNGDNFYQRNDILYIQGDSQKYIVVKSTKNLIKVRKL